jgi:hypothetical protein
MNENNYNIEFKSTTYILWQTITIKWKIRTNIYLNIIYNTKLLTALGNLSHPNLFSSVLRVFVPFMNIVSLESGPHFYF